MANFKQFRIVSNGTSNTYSVKDETARNSITQIENTLSGKVGSSSVTTLWVGTQQQYDAIQEKDPATLYFIKEA